MKVLLISGSPKPNGNTSLLMQECSKVIEEHGVEAEIVSFAGKKIEACIACGKCSKTGKCGLDDGLNEIIDKIRGTYCWHARLLWNRSRRRNVRLATHRICCAQQR
jgi:multimeric flavodoxin WrbA